MRKAQLKHVVQLKAMGVATKITSLSKYPRYKEHRTLNMTAKGLATCPYVRLFYVWCCLFFSCKKKAITSL